MKIRSLISFGAFLFLSFSIATGQEPAVSLAQVLNTAREKNPDILAARQTWKAKKALVRSAGTWPNPTLSYMEEREPSGMEGVDPMKMRTTSIEQDIPFPGKLTADSRMQRHESLIAEAAYRDKLFEVLKDVRLRYYELYMTDRRITLATESVAILQSSLRSAQSRLSSAPRSRSASPSMSESQGTPAKSSMSGGVSAADVFMVQTELRKMENMLFEEKQRRILMEIELNTLLNQPSETPWGAVQPPVLADLPVSLTDVQRLARANAPLYQSAGHERRHSQSMLTRSRLEFAPDVSLMYGKKSAEAGPDGNQFGVGLSIPLWLQRPVAQYKFAKAHNEEAEANAQAMKNMVTKMVHMEYVETQTHLTLSRNYIDGILPPAKSSLEISRQRYASGQTDFLRLLEAFRSWIDAHNQFEEQLYHYGEHWSELERWVGLDLSQAKQAVEQLNLKPEENIHGH